MPAIAIIGAGPGLGAAVAARFGREGHRVALISRTREKLDRLCDDLRAGGVEARGYTADVRDRDALAAVLASAEADLGPIEVLQYSPVPRQEFLRPVLETTVTDLAAGADFSILGPATAITTVLPRMIERGRGTILLVNGSSAVRPNANVAGTSIVFAAESVYGQLLHDAVAQHGVHVGQLIIPGAIGGGDPLYAPGALADRLWAIHVDRGPFRATVGAEDS